MKYSLKIFLSTILLVATSFIIGGCVLVYQNFQVSLENAINQSVREHYTEKYLLELEFSTQIQNGYSIENVLKISGAKTQQNAAWLNMPTAIISDKQVLYSTLNNKYEISFSEESVSDLFYTIQLIDEKQFLFITSNNEFLSWHYQIITQTDLSAVFEEQQRQLQSLFQIGFVVISICGLGSAVMAGALSLRVVQLNKAALLVINGKLDTAVSTKGHDEIAQLAASFNQMTATLSKDIETLKEYARKRDQFVSDFSHELKTPMTSIIGYADLLRSTKCSQSITEEAAGYIFSEGKRLLALSQKLLDIMRLQKSDFSLSEIPLNSVISQSVETVQPAYDKMRITLKSPIVNGAVLGDEDLLKTLFVNLLDNARKACKTGDTVSIEINTKSNHYIISISDNGCGMAQEELAHIKEAFYMIDKSRSRKENGAGLGLALCSEIAQIHHAKLTFESKLGIGTTVTFALQSSIKEDGK